MGTKVNHFKARVELLCKRRGLTLREIAERVGKTPQGFHDILQRGDPKASLLRDICSALHVGTDEILEEVSPDEYGEAFMPTMDADAQ